MRCDSLWCRPDCGTLEFQLTHLYEMWHDLTVSSVNSTHFNSHISMRCDQLISALYDVSKPISTHTSLWDVTKTMIENNIQFFISTHTSLWDVTWNGQTMLNSDVFQLTHLYEMWLDMLLQSNLKFGAISTHTSLWDVTTLEFVVQMISVISTHTSLWDVTAIYGER